jgi:hypothetical protein
MTPDSNRQSDFPEQDRQFLFWKHQHEPATGKALCDNELRDQPGDGGRGPNAQA